VVVEPGGYWIGWFRWRLVFGNDSPLNKHTSRGSRHQIKTKWGSIRNQKKQNGEA
jgi:hypothetical protein